MKKNIIHSIIFVMIISLFSLMKYSFNINSNSNKSIVIETSAEILPEIKTLNEMKISTASIDSELKVIEEPKLEVIFNENNLNEISNITYEEMEKLLSDTTMSHLADAIVDSEREYGVNAFFTLSVIALESSWATSSRVTDSNNLTGMAVYGDYSPGEYFDTQYECVLETTRQIKENYLLSDGMYYNGASTIGVNVRYSSNSNWYSIVNQIAYEMMDKYNGLTKGD